MSWARASYAMLSRRGTTERWCGSSPAPVSEMLRTEARLGLALPPSYRSFLSVSNGWSPFGTFIRRLLPVHELMQYREANPNDLVSILEMGEDDISDSDYLDYESLRNRQGLRPRYYAESLLVSEGCGGGELVLLNPSVIAADGEWETIFFANWIPGNRRYRSFLDFVEYSVKSLENLEGG